MYRMVFYKGKCINRYCTHEAENVCVRLITGWCMEKKCSDSDLKNLTKEQLIDEITELRNAIRKHKTCTGHDLCWFQPELWSLLPELSNEDIEVPDWPQFMRGCIRYRESLDTQIPDALRVNKEFTED